MIYGFGPIESDAVMVEETNGRSGEIRTPDPLLPKQVRYQAALRSVSLRASTV